MFQEDFSLCMLYRDFFLILVMLFPVVILIIAGAISLKRLTPKDPKDFVAKFHSRDLIMKAPRGLLILFFVSVFTSLTIMVIVSIFPGVFPESPERVEYTVLNPDKTIRGHAVWPTEYFVFENGMKSDLKTPTPVVETWQQTPEKTRFINNTSQRLYLYRVEFIVDNLIRSPRNFITEIPAYSYVELCCKPVSYGDLPETWPIINAKQVTVFHLSPTLLEN